jgi:hypothetical protein
VTCTKRFFMRTRNEGFDNHEKCLKDDCIFHVWKCNECMFTKWGYTWLYERWQEPVCSDCGNDMMYSHTEVETPIEPNNNPFWQKGEKENEKSD